MLVCIGMLGPTLDRGTDARRWNGWRPTVSLFQQEDMIIDRFELLYQPQFATLAEIVIEDIERLSPHTEVHGHLMPLDDPWDFEHVYEQLYTFTRQYPFDTDEHDYIVHITTGTHVAQICTFLLTESRHLPAKLIQTSPPNKRHPGAGTYTVIDLDLSRYDALFARFQQEQQESISFLKAGIDTKSRNFNTLIERIERVAMVSSDPMLLMGPTGAGKTRLARRVYDLKKQRRQVEGRFVEVNCATLRGDAAMSTLFGHTKGAFTGAISARPGLLKAAHKGILFLDEIGELGLDEQAMLLRALESKRFMPMGADTETSSDFQLIAGTNRDLRKDVSEGKFREDLLARINLWTFTLPGLKDRREDIEPNLDYELETYTQRTNQRVTINKEARDHFLRFATDPQTLWSGNFRDLNACVTRMATLCHGQRIKREDVDEEIQRLRYNWAHHDDRNDGDETLEAILGQTRFEQLDRFDRVQLADVVAVCRQSKSLSAAGRTLFAASRQQKKSSNDADRLRKYLARFELTFKDIQAHES